MVMILSVGLSSETLIEHERRTSPLMCTEQAPHCATPQPYLVPVSPTCSRITHSSGVSGSTATSWTAPLMLSFAMGLPLSPSTRSCVRIVVVARLPGRDEVVGPAARKNNASGAALPMAVAGVVAAGRRPYIPLGDNREAP